MVTVTPGPLTPVEEQVLSEALEQATEVNQREDKANTWTVVQSILATQRIRTSSD